MTITTRDGLIAALAANRTIAFSKSGGGNSSALFYTYFRGAGQPGAAGAIPASTGVQLSRSSAGALPLPAPSGVTYLSSLLCASNSTQTTLVCDRLVEFGGLISTTTSTQTVSALALPARATGALDVELWLEIYTGGGNLAANGVINASYTNQSGVSGRTATIQGFVVNGLVGDRRSFPFTLQAGDTGVQSVQSLTFPVAATAVAGNLGFALRRTLLTSYSTAANVSFVKGWPDTGLTVCPDDACLEILHMQGATTSDNGRIIGTLGIVQG